MLELTVTENLLHYDQPLVVLANDASARQYLGVAFGDDSSSGMTFVGIDRATLDRLERGELDVRTVMLHSDDVIAEAEGSADVGETLLASFVTFVREDALPKPGMLLSALGAPA